MIQAQVRVVSGARGERVMDGPFAEAKEMVGGYFLLTDTTLDEVSRPIAITRAARAPSRPGRGRRRSPG